MKTLEEMLSELTGLGMTLELSKSCGLQQVRVKDRQGESFGPTFEVGVRYTYDALYPVLTAEELLAEADKALDRIKELAIVEDWQQKYKQFKDRGIR